MKRVFGLIVLGAAIGIWEIAVRPFLPTALALRPLLPCLVLVLTIGRPSSVVYVGLTGALLLDTFAIVPELALIRYAAIFFIMFALNRFILTNRSLYTSLALVIFGRIGERGSAWLVARFLDDGSARFNPGILLNWSTVVLWDALIVAIIFVVLTFLTRRFMPVVSVSRVR